MPLPGHTPLRTHEAGEPARQDAGPAPAPPRALRGGAAPPSAVPMPPSGQPRRFSRFTLQADSLEGAWREVRRVVGERDLDVRVAAAGVAPPTGAASAAAGARRSLLRQWLKRLPVAHPRPGDGRGAASAGGPAAG